MNINIAIVGGRLTCDPKSTTSPKGRAITEFPIATNRKFTGEDERVWEETTFIDVVCWARLAEVAAQFCRKGSPVLVKGRLQLDQWEDKETNAKRSKLRLVAESIDFLDHKPAEATADEPAAPAKSETKKRRARHEEAAAA